MLRRSLILAACAAFLVVPATADAMIQIDKGIAGARVNNTKAQVRAALGTPASVKNGTNDFGAFTQFRYTGGLRIVFQGGSRVSSIDLTGQGDRTARGVGVGSTERAVKRKVPGVTCETIVGFRSCHTGDFLPGKRMTDFHIRNGKVSRVTVGIVID
jgi:hypothetical protein